MHKLADDTLLNLFKEQLGNQIEKLVKNYTLDNDGQGLIWWYFMNFHKMNKTEVEEIFCDGGGDLGIDAIFIDDTSSRVHFYQFKNPQKLIAGFPTGDVDKVITGLTTIMANDYSSIANQALKDRIDEIYRIVPSGYTLHLVTSGEGIAREATVKIKNFIKSLKAPSTDFFVYEVEDLKTLQDRFYTCNLPAVDETIPFKLPQAPYMVRAANHDSYIFHLEGYSLAQLYEKFGEQLLQQNIRGFEGDNSTNRAIEDSCTTPEASNFYQYNNGITFLCEEAKWDQFSWYITLTRAQVVNGGQTLRILYKTYKKSKLKKEVTVSVRVITSKGDKEFGGNVAVNLNNQTRVESSFLRSNDPRVVQLATALASTGWYLERREGEVLNMSELEKQGATNKLGRSLNDDIIIPLKEGAQAYTATYKRLPEIAKKNPKLIFLNTGDGGHFPLIFGPDISAEKFINAYRLYKKISALVDNFKVLKRKRSRMEDWRAEYTTLLGFQLVNTYESELDEVIPVSVIFLCALLFDRYITGQKWPVEDLLNAISEDKPSAATDTLCLIIKYSKEHPREKSWATLMKSQPFFEQVAVYIKKQDKKSSRHQVSKVVHDKVINDEI